MKIALVTGAGHRLGRELALGLGRAGYTVAVHYRTSATDAAETLRLLRDQGADGAPFQADLAEDEGSRLLAEAVLSRWERLDVLVHSASTWIEKPFFDMTETDWEETFRTGPKAAFFLVQALAPALQRVEGSVLLISDVAARKAWPNHIPHAAAKAALESLVINLAVALAPKIRVNGIAPGIVLPPADLSDETVKRLVARTPLGRQAAVEDLVDAAVELLRNRSITGQTLAVDCGRSLV